MDIPTLLRHFADPALLAQLSFSQKMIAGLVTTVLGMGVTFVALIILQAVVWLLGRFGRDHQPAALDRPAVQTAHRRAGTGDDPGAETVAAITVALAVMLQVEPRRLVIREIRRVGDTAPAWNRAGRLEQLRDRGRCPKRS